MRSRLLIELKQSDEPAWAYLEYQHAQVLDTIRSIYAKARERVKGVSDVLHASQSMTELWEAASARVCEEQPSTSTSGADSLKKQLAQPQYQINTLSCELTHSLLLIDLLHDPPANPIDAAWLAIQSLVKQLSEYVSRSLPGFWRIAKACMDGKYRKVCAPTSRHS